MGELVIYRLHSIEIFGFWENAKVHSNFNKDINIFIGKNGTGKTTFIRILQSVLTANISMMTALSFSKVILKFSSINDDEIFTLKVEKDKKDTCLIKYQFDGEKIFTIPVVFDDQSIEYYEHIRINILNVFKEVRHSLNQIFNVSWLSVLREVNRTRDDDRDYNRRAHRDRSSPLDVKLRELMVGLTEYQLKIEAKVREIADQFQKEVLMIMLFDNNLDKIDISNIIEELSYDKLKKDQKELINAYKELGITNQSAEQRINNQFDILKKSIKTINEKIDSVKKGKIDGSSATLTISIEDIVSLPLYNRTQSIINNSMTAKQKRADVIFPLTQYLGILQKFSPEKEFKLSSSGGLNIFKKGKELQISDLSSGEKQLLIFLTETLLEEGKPFIFIADEPELSLHIEWQSMLLPSIKKINENAQVIVATHAPEIAGRYGKSIINMEDVVNESIQFF